MRLKNKPSSSKMMRGAPSASRMKEKESSRRYPITSLPQDVIVEVAVQLASSSFTPLADLQSLRATCYQLYEASRARKVGCFLAVDKEWAKHWWDKKGYFIFLQHCADSGNPDASFILGLEHIYNLRRKASGVRHLLRAAKCGHLSSAYFSGIILFRDLATQELGMDLLNRVAAGNACAKNAASECTTSGSPYIGMCRRDVAEVIRKISMKKWHLEPRMLCEDPLYGRIVNRGRDATDRWLGEERIQRQFCSQQCRWTEECYRLFERI